MGEVEIYTAPPCVPPPRSEDERPAYLQHLADRLRTFTCADPDTGAVITYQDLDGAESSYMVASTTAGGGDHAILVHLPWTQRLYGIEDGLTVAAVRSRILLEELLA